MRRTRSILKRLSVWPNQVRVTVTAFTRDLGHCSCCNLSIKRFLAVTNRTMEHYNSAHPGIWWKENRFSPWRNHCIRESACCFWYVTGTIRVAVCNRIFTISSWLVLGSKFAAKGGRRKKRRTKLREAGEGYLRHPLHPFPGLMNSLVYSFHWNAG